MKVIIKQNYLDLQLKRVVLNGEELEVTRERAQQLHNLGVTNDFTEELVEVKKEEKEEKKPAKRKKK